MSAIAELKRLPETVEQSDSFVNAVIGELLDGNVNPVEVAIRVKLLQNTLDKIAKDVRVKNLLIEQVELGNTEAIGGTIKLKQRRNSDFTADPLWQQKKGEMKAREALLKECNGFDPETGEQVVFDKFTEYLEIKL